MENFEENWIKNSFDYLINNYNNDLEIYSVEHKDDYYNDVNNNLNLKLVEEEEEEMITEEYFCDSTCEQKFSLLIKKINETENFDLNKLKKITNNGKSLFMLINNYYFKKGFNHNEINRTNN